MNRNDLFISFNEIDDDILKRSESAVSNKKYPAPLRWGTLVAGVLILLVTISPFFSNNDTTPPPDIFLAQINTSATYSNLSELLEYLSKNEDHELVYGISNGNNPSSNTSELLDKQKEKLVKGADTVIDAKGKYTYHKGEKNEIYISQLSQIFSKKTKKVGSIKINTSLSAVDVFVDNLFLYKNNLIVVSDGNTFSGDEYSKVSIYDITSPKRPVKKDEFVQKGYLVDSWMVGSKLYLATDDGACACGYTSTSNTSNYYPELYHNEKSVEWGNDSIFILGEPSRIAYTAISVINTNSRKIEKKAALYGDISDIYYGTNWISLIVKNELSSPVLYGFDKNLRCTNKVDIANSINQPESKINIFSVSKIGNTYRMIGNSRDKFDYPIKEYPVTASPIVITLNEINQKIEFTIATDTVIDYSAPYTEIIWEHNRAIICAGKAKEFQTDKYKIAYETVFMFAEFNSDTINFYESTLKAEYINGGYNYTIGNPLDYIETLIPMGNGIYVRYAHYNNGCRGFEVYDFSSSTAPHHLWSSEKLLGDTEVFEYYCHVYDENTFGILKVELGEGDTDDNQQIKYSWCIYTVNPNNQNAVTLEKEYHLNLETERFQSAKGLRFAIFTADNNIYYSSSYIDTVRRLE